MKTSRHFPKRLSALVATVAFAAIPSIHAQTAPAAATSPAASTKEEAVVLSVFEVESTRDSGYRATNSVSGTRINVK